MSPNKRHRTVREPEGSGSIVHILRNADQAFGETNYHNFWVGCGYKKKKKKRIAATRYTNDVLAFTIRLKLHFQRCHSTANVMIKPDAPKFKASNKKIICDIRDTL